MATTPLGDYLRNLRARVSPEQVGLPTTGVRRVPGLRREEVATLAGVSADYYVRLEQGRERNPSVQVLDALAAVLELDDDARLHLMHLAGVTPRPRAASVERVSPELVALMDAWPNQPALVLGRAYDVLAANQLGTALFGPAGETNLVHKVFLDPAGRSFYADWDTIAANSVAGLRMAHGEAPDHPRLRALLTGMLDRSPEFARLWSRHTARGKTVERKHLVHPEVGDLHLHMQTFDVRAAPGQQLIVYHAEPGSPSAHNLALLGALAATELSGADRSGGGPPRGRR
ncbi:helix-turn-helix domain-containing protein [Actinokineospora bangkokensis]|uniref:Transcriptional regulator n=1 Tax=Actinokineospora bangkokensis TaxID=1193682 RepID=A0A1Q9LLG0_9PSEU|nr:helix-turn-helix transcriptional regulator [Actinokineospora bangkokensis]OLR92833.1 transcriptional regulator [Actinokineospora bangkokensis]